MVGRIRSNPAIAAQQAQQAAATGSMGDRSVTRGKSVFAAVRSALSRAAHYVSASFKSLYSRQVRVGQTHAARAAAAPQAGAEQKDTPLALEKAGKWPADVKGLRTMFQYEAVKETGITAQMTKDITRSDYIIGGEDMQRDPGHALHSLRGLVKDKKGGFDEKMLLAVSQVAHQGLLAEGETKLIMGLFNEHGVTPAGKTGGTGNSRYEVQRLKNGDMRINASSHTDITSVIGPDGKSVSKLKDGSFYEYSFSVTISAKSVAKGQPTLTATPVRYAYSLNEQ